MSDFHRETTFPVLADVLEERRRQHEKWGVQRHSWPEFITILTEEVGEAAMCAVECHWHEAGTADLRMELVQVAAVAVQIVELIDELATSEPVQP